MAKTNEELNTLKEEYQTLVTKINELSDVELKFVVGGSHQGISDFYLTTIGHWYRHSKDSTFIYRVKNAYEPIPDANGKPISPSAILDRFWFNGLEAWYYGTVTEIACDNNGHYQEIDAPTIIHDQKMYITKPF